MLVEIFLQLLVCIVDVELLKAVHLQEGRQPDGGSGTGGTRKTCGELTVRSVYDSNMTENIQVRRRKRSDLRSAAEEF